MNQPNQFEATDYSNTESLLNNNPDQGHDHDALNQTKMSAPTHDYPDQSLTTHDQRTEFNIQAGHRSLYAEQFKPKNQK